VDISVKSLIRRFWMKMSLTWFLVILEGMSLVAMPMVIGWAVDDLLNKSLTGVYQLAGLCLILLLVGSIRRFYDTRAYTKIYTSVSNGLVREEHKHATNLSKISARVNLFSEFIKFLENSIPGILQQLINLVGTMVIIFFIDVRVFFACIISALISMLIYIISGKKIFSLNKGGNDELEKQVDVIASKNKNSINEHFKKMMSWQIKLSDLETVNFALIWIFLSAAMLFTVITVSSSSSSTFGQIVSAVMYVFGFIESTMVFPLYYQQLVRLKEISGRLARS